MKQGFTLVELLAVIVILGILSLIAIPIIDKSLNSSKSSLSDVQEDQIAKTAEDYYAEHLDELPSDGDTVCITFNELQTSGYLSLDVIDPKTNEDYDLTRSKVCVTRTDSSYTYEVKGVTN